MRQETAENPVAFHPEDTTVDEALEEPDPRPLPESSRH